MGIQVRPTLLLVVIVTVLAASGCAPHTVTGPTGPRTGEPGVNTDKVRPDMLPGSIPQTGAFKPDERWIASANWTQLPKIYFDFDCALIRPSERPALQQIADYMTAHPSAYLLIAGHCDERGTAEYNRALGERRANAAREYLVRLGINPDRIATISYGEERPADPGHNEAAWAKNRRAEFGVGPLQP